LLPLIALGVRPTEAGQVLLDAEAAIRTSMSSAATELAALAEGSTAVVRLGAFISAAATIAPPSLAHLRATHPGVHLILRGMEQTDTTARFTTGAMSFGPGGVQSGMTTMTTRVLSVSVPVADQDAALRFYTEVPGCELRTDVDVWPGARMIEVVPPGSSVALVLLPPNSEIPVAIRLGTSDAQRAHDKIREAGVTLHNDELVLMEGVPPMFLVHRPRRQRTGLL
jgi:hypothetical protein